MHQLRGPSVLCTKTYIYDVGNVSVSYGYIQHPPKYVLYGPWESHNDIMMGTNCLLTEKLSVYKKYLLLSKELSFLKKKRRRFLFQQFTRQDWSENVRENLMCPRIWIFRILFNGRGFFVLSLHNYTTKNAIKICSAPTLSCDLKLTSEGYYMALKAIKSLRKGASTKRPSLRTSLPYITVLVYVIPCIIYSKTIPVCIFYNADSSG